MIDLSRLWQILFILLILLLTRLWMSSPDTRVFNVDAAGYHNLADNWLSGRGFTLQTDLPYCPDALRTPVYPLFIAGNYSLFGHNQPVIFIMQSLLDVIVGAIVFRILYGLSHRRYFVALAGLLAYTLTLSQWHYTHLLLTESLLAFLLAMTCWFLWLALHRQKSWAFIATGIFLGLSVLCKPTVQPIIPIVILIIFIVNWRRSFLLIIALLLTVLPWLTRNYLIFGDVFLSRTYAENLSRVAAPATLAETQGGNIFIWSPEWESLFLGIVDETRQRHGWASFDVSCAEWEQRRLQIAAISSEIIREHPLAFVSAYIKGVWNGLQGQEQLYWYSLISGESPDSVGRYNGAPINQLPPGLLIMGILWTGTMVIFYLSSAIGAVILLRKYPALTLILLLIITTGLILPGPLAWVRFRVPVMPQMIILSVVGCAAMRDRGLNKNSRLK